MFLNHVPDFTSAEKNFKLDEVIYLGLKRDQQWISLIIYIYHSLSELEGLLRPWYYAVKFLKEIDCSSAWWPIRFSLKIFICPHKEAALHLDKEYAAACRGKCYLISFFFLGIHFFSRNLISKLKNVLVAFPLVLDVSVMKNTWLFKRPYIT